MSERRAFEFEVVQDGVVVASGCASTWAEAEREAMHYAMMYAQDGPVTVRFPPTHQSGDPNE